MEAAFEEAQSAVISFMQEGGYSKSYVSCARSALRDFREHLKVSGSEPSCRTAQSQIRFGPSAAD